MGFSALSSKQHFNPFNGALRYPAHQPSASQENSGSDADNNIKETDRSSRQMDLKNSKGAIFSWFGGPPGPPSRQESDSSVETQEKMKSIDDDIELCPISSTTEYIPSSQVHLNPQGYSTATPITSPKPDDHSDTVFKQATRVLKNTVLHDARNLRNQTERLAGWDVNSAHEAKVHSSFIQSEENTPYSSLSASGALDLPATKRPRKGMANPCRLLPRIPISQLSRRSIQSLRQRQYWGYHSRPNKNDLTESIQRTPNPFTFYAWCRGGFEDTG